MPMGTMTRNRFQSCIDECNKCSQSCYQCLDLCMSEPDANSRKNCMKLLVECARMCEMSSEIMSINGEFSTAHCGLCATICDRCAEECSKFKDTHCKDCAQECSTCADECRNMAGM